MLTPEEIKAAKSAKYFQNGASYGKGLDCLCPIGMVMKERGIKLNVTPTGFVYPDIPMSKESITASRDVTEWLGYVNHIFSFSDTLYAKLEGCNVQLPPEEKE